MSSSFELSATTRSQIGKSNSNRLRRLEGLMPAVIYGGDDGPMSVSISHNQVMIGTKSEAFFSSILTIEVDGKKEQVVIKDIQRHPYKNEILHMDFLRIKATDAITMKVPLHFTGEDIAPGVKSGGAVSHLMTEIDIKCLPKDLPEFINVDISKLGLDEAVHLSELAIPDTLEIVQLTHGADHDLPVVSIHKVKVQAVEDEAPVATDTGSDDGKDSDQDKSKQEDSKTENS